MSDFFIRSKSIMDPGDLRLEYQNWWVNYRYTHSRAAQDLEWIMTLSVIWWSEREEPPEQLVGARVEVPE